MASVRSRTQNTKRAHAMKTTSLSDSSVSYGHVMLIYTGGTIGMVPNDDGGKFLKMQQFHSKLFSFVEQ